MLVTGCWMGIHPLNSHPASDILHPASAEAATEFRLNEHSENAIEANRVR